MALHKARMKSGFKLPQCEKHFHDHDETWLILKGKGTGYWIDPMGQRIDFDLEEGDVWMIPVGYEHGSDGPNSEDFEITVFNGTVHPGSRTMGHYYMEQEGAIPVFELEWIETNRYRRTLGPAPEAAEKK